MNFERERLEAIAAGRRALASLEAADRDLKSARNWGFLDMFSSRSMLTSLIKHSKMDGARQHMDEARYDLGCFSSELRDVSMACDLNIDVNGFISFADIFMDNFFVDWAVQSRIERAREQVEYAIRMVSNILSRLELMRG